MSDNANGRGERRDDDVAKTNRCSHCGRPVARAAGGVGGPETRPVFCCAGCALRQAVPVDADGNFPANAALGAALGVGFVQFNQLLLAGLAVFMARRADLALADKLVLGSLVAAVVTWLALVFFQLRAGARAVWDHAVAAAAGAGVVAAWITRSPWCAAGATLLLLAWSGRGVFRTKAVGP